MENTKSLIVNENEKTASRNPETALQHPSFSIEINKAWELYRENFNEILS